jgi:hypothetical protein
MAEEDKTPKKEKKKEPWVVAQARRAVESAQTAIDNATNDVTKKAAEEDLKRAKERLQELLRTQRRAGRASRRVEDAQAAVDAAAETPGKADDRRARERLEREQARAERTGEARDEAREGARDFFYSEMGPMIAEAIREFPQLREFFRRAIAEGWNAAKQERELNNPENAWFKWWDSRGKYWRQGFAKQYRSGATSGTWADDIKEARDIIRAAAKDKGVTLTPEQEDRLARRYWYSEWQSNPAALESWMVQRAATQREQGVTDPEAEVDPLLPANRNTKIRELRDLAEAYGLEFDDTVLGDWADLILDPMKNTNGIEDIRFKEFLVQESRSKYTTFGDQLDADTNLRQLAGGYVSELARLLEIDPTSIRFTPTGMDPLLQRALTNIDPETGKPSRIPLWEFTKQIRQDDRWQFTDNARDSYMSAGSKFAQALGLAG